jgi:hypothetical protein
MGPKSAPKRTHLLWEIRTGMHIHIYYAAGIILYIPVWCTSPPGAKVFRQKTGRIPSNQGSCDQGLKRGTLHFGYF